jgi:hypothetical protein
MNDAAEGAADAQNGPPGDQLRASRRVLAEMKARTDRAADAQVLVLASWGETSRPSRNIQSVYCVFTNYRQRSRSSRGGTCGPTCSLDTGDRFDGAITDFHLSKNEGTSAHVRRGGRADPTRVLEVQIAGQMPMLWRGARNLRA